MNVTPAGTPAAVRVLGFIDASEPCLEPYAVARVDALEKACADAGPTLEAAVQVFRGGQSRTRKVLTGLAMIGAHVAAPALGFAVGGGVGLALGALAAAGMWASGGLRQGANLILSAAHHRGLMPDGDWTGMRIYEVSADKTAGIDSTMLKEDAGTRRPTAPALHDFFRTHAKPAPTTIIYASGHGLAYRSAAGLPATELTEELREAVRQSGKKADVLVMEACMLGNLETLSEFSEVARVAVVSEEVLITGAMPVREMMADAAKSGGTAQEIATRMVGMAGPKLFTMAAVDLDRIPDLLSSLDALGGTLQQEITAGNSGAIRAALHDAAQFPRAADLTVERKLLRLSDLGEFLHALQAQPLDAATLAAARDAEQRLQQAVIARSGAPSYDGATGISFQNTAAPSLLEWAVGRYEDVRLPAGWTEFLKRLDEA